MTYCTAWLLEITGSHFFVKKLRIFWTLIIITMYLMRKRACLEVCDNVLCVTSFIFWCQQWFTNLTYFQTSAIQWLSDQSDQVSRTPQLGTGVRVSRHSTLVNFEFFTPIILQSFIIYHKGPPYGFSSSYS